MDEKYYYISYAWKSKSRWEYSNDTCWGCPFKYLMKLRDECRSEYTLEYVLLNQFEITKEQYYEGYDKF